MLLLTLKQMRLKAEYLVSVNLATTTALNAKINEVRNEIPHIINLATTNALTAVENKIPNVSNLVKKLTITDHDHDKYITTKEFNTLT